jgi:hypothetical protein
MRKTTTTPLGLGIALLCLLILGACPQSTDTPDKEIDQVTITNIPSKVKGNGPDSYKIYVQLSASMDETAPHAAVSSEKIEGQSNVTLKLYKNKDMAVPCTVSGKYYVAVTICPQNAPNVDSIEAQVLGYSMVSTSKIESIDWGSLEDIPIKSKIEAIYDLIIKEDTDITTP